MIGLWGILLLTATTEAAWTNFVIFDSHYLPMAKCWFRWYRRNASPNHLKVGCMDEASCEEARGWPDDLASKVEVVEEFNLYDLDPVTSKVVQPLGAIESSKRPRSKRKRRKTASLLMRSQVEWPRQKYIHLFHRMLWDTLEQRQQDVLHLDVDALWLKPLDHRLKAVLAAHPDVDIIASSSRESNPRDLVEKWGFVLNVGFILYRYTEPMKLLFDEELLRASVPSCQQLLNYALHRKGCRWTGNDTSSSDQLGHCGELKVVALSQDFVSRSLDWTYDGAKEVQWELPSVAHPDTGRLALRGIDRMRQFRDMNLC